MTSRNTNVSWVSNIPQSLIKTELEGLYGSKVLQDMGEIIELYGIYENGSDFDTETNGDYVPADLKYRIARALLDKEVRFLFSLPPDFYVDVDLSEDKEQAKEDASIYKDLVDAVLAENNFQLNLIKAAKDCFIGKRVALMYNINEEEGIQVSFLPSLEFVYDVAPNDANKLEKIIAFYGLNAENSKSEQRIYKKKYWMQNGLCWYSEEVFDGLGNLVETVYPESPTRFTFIPAYVILNDGLTGDLVGVSELELLLDYESWYSRLAASDMDAERKGMNPILYTIDAAPESTKGLSTAAGAYWDLSSDQNQATDKQAQAGVLDRPMTYSDALGTTLNRIKQAMYEAVAVPNVSPEALKGVVTSGKTLKAIYWDLIVRCNEKMLAWRPALEFLVKCIIEGVRLYPAAGKFYIEESLPDRPYTARVDNQYSLPEDEQEEKTTDLAEVQAQTMSKKSYMKKWRGLTDDEADEEIRQIAMERQLLEDNFSMPPTSGENTGNPPEEQEETEENPIKE